MDETKVENRVRRKLPDYEETLRKNARKVLLEAGVPPDQVDAEWERLRAQPLPFDLPTDEELDEMSARRAAGKPELDRMRTH